MTYSREQLEKDISDIVDETLSLRISKGHDYAGASDDCLDNYRDGGSEYVVFRLGEKYHRLRNYVKQKKLLVEDESIDDTINDIINLAFYIKIMRRQEQNNE